MSKKSFEVLSKMLDTTAKILGKEPIENSRVAMYYWLLDDIGIDDLEVAFKAHLRDPERGRFFPSPADLMAQIQRSEKSGHVSSDEAWAIAIKAADEYATVVWTDQIRQAWSIAREVHDIGDEIGARMAFRAAYDRICRDNKNEHWVVSEGADKTARQAAIQLALTQGRLTPQQAQQYPQIEAGNTPIPLMLENIAKADPGKAKARIDQLRGILSKPRPIDATREQFRIAENAKKEHIKNIVMQKTHKQKMGAA